MQHDSGYWTFSAFNIKYDSQHPLFSPPDMPKELRLQAVRAAVLLLPDENREALRTLLCLLSDVTASVAENQMTPTNLAVCLAPSLFHLNTLRRKESSSPRCVSCAACAPWLPSLALVIAWAAYITCSVLYIVKTGKGSFEKTKEQDTVDGGEEKWREHSFREEEIEMLHKHLNLSKKHILFGQKRVYQVFLCSL